MDGKQPLLLLISTDKLGTIGAYTSLALRGGIYSYELDSNVFHFSMNNGIKYYPNDYTIQNINQYSKNLGCF